MCPGKSRGPGKEASAKCGVVKFSDSGMTLERVYSSKNNVTTGRKVEVTRISEIVQARTKEATDRFKEVPHEMKFGTRALNQ